MPTPSAPSDPSRKKSRGKIARFVRLLGAFCDPRAWAHGVKLVNYYNYSHVQPLRLISQGAGCAISPNAVFSNAERITLGDRVSVGARTTLWAGHANGRIEVGDDALFGPDVLVTCSGYRFNDGQPVTKQAMDEADVIIGKDVWLAARVVVLPGARIGDGAIIGAGSVVRGEIPAMSIAVGVPAKVVGARQLPGAEARP